MQENKTYTNRSDFMTKTIPLTTNAEVSVALVGDGNHVKVENRGNGIVYASKYSGIIAGADNVLAIDSGVTKLLTDVCSYSIQDSVGAYRGTVYLLADSDTSVEMTTTNNSNFKFVKKGGDGFTPIVSSDKFICECNQLNYVVDSYTEIVNIVAQPVDCICAVGDSVTLKVVATGNELVYQWQKQYTLGDIINKWKNMDGKTSNTLSFEVKSTAFRVGMQFRCVVTDKYGNQMISNSVKLIEKEEL